MTAALDRWLVRSGSCVPIVQRLAALGGLGSFDGYRGTLTSSAGTIELAVRDETRASVRLAPAHSSQHEQKAGLAAEHALARTLALPGSLRWASLAGVRTLLADVCVPRAADLVPALASAIAALRSEAGLPPLTAPSPEVSIPCAPPAAWLADLAWPADDVVHGDDFVELRARVRESVHAVRVSALATGGLLCRTSLLALDTRIGLDSGSTRAAIAEEAVHWNARLWHARVALAGESLVCETRLEESARGSALLAERARALAGAAYRVRRPLRVLAESADVAQVHAALFQLRLPDNQTSEVNR